MSSDNEFITILRIVRHFVQLVIEITFEIVVACLLIVPLCIPWRACAVLGTTFPQEGTCIERRREFRWRGAGHVIVAFTDVIVAPLGGLALLCPTRIWPVLDLLLRRSEYNNYSEVDDADDLCAAIQYDVKLRICLVANFFGAIADLPAIVLGCIAICHPWRTVEMLGGAARILSEVAAWSGYRHAFSIPYGSISLGTSLKELWRNRAKTASDWQRMDEDKKRKKRGPLSRCRRLIRHIAGQQFSGRWSEPLSALRHWSLVNGAECFLDWICLAMGAASILFPTRLVPLLCEVMYLRHIDWPIWQFTISNRHCEIQCFPWRRLHLLLVCNLAYGLLDVLWMLCSSFVVGTVIRAFPLVFDIWFDWPNSPKQVSIDMSTYQGVLDLGPDIQPEDFSGTYTRLGRFGHSRCYQRVGSQERGTSGLGFLGFWDDWWHLCPFAVTSTAVVRFKASTIARGHSPVSNSQPGSWQFRAGSEDSTWKVVSGELDVILNEAAVHTTWFGERGYNMQVRRHSFWHALLFVIDLVFCPFALVVLLTVYRLPALLAQMRRDAEDYTIKRGADAWSGKCLKLRFGWHSRKEVVRQVLLVVCDVAILPFLFILRITCYRFPDIGKFNYFNASFHAMVVLNVLVLIGDVVLLLPAAVVALTYYRLRYVVHRRRSQQGRAYETLPKDQPSTPVSQVLEKTTDVSKENQFSDQEKKLTQVIGRSVSSTLDCEAETPTNIHVDEANSLLELHECLPKETIVQADETQSSPEKSPGAIRSRLENSSHRFWIDFSTRKEMMRQGSLVICDLFFSPFIVLVYLTRYRWSHVAEQASPYNVMMHRSALSNSIVVCCDILLCVPCMLLQIIIVRRLPPIIRTMRELPPQKGSAYFEETNEEYIPETWDGRVRTEIIFQTAGSVGDILYLPCFLLVAITWYRMQQVDLFDLSVDYHQQVWDNSLVVFVDLLVHLPMLLITSLSMYRAWPLCLVLQQCRHAFGCCCRSSEARRRGHVQLPDSEQRIMRDMVNDDPEWGDLVDWNETGPLDEEHRDLRSVIRCEFLGLLFDIPFYPIALLHLITFWRVPVLLRKFGEQPRAADRRRLLLYHLMLTFRDFLATPLFAFLLVTHRGPRLLMRLCARRHCTLQGAPRFEIEAAEVTFNDRTGRPRLSFEVNCVQGFRRLSKGSLKVQLAGSGFWRSLKETFGSFVTSVVQSLLPMKLRRGDTDIYELFSGQQPVEAGDRIKLSITVPVKVTQGAVARGIGRLAGDEWILLQLEGRDAFSWRKFVLCAGAIRVRAFENIAKQAGGRINGEELGDADVVRHCQAGQHLGVVESFAPLVLTEFGQFILDVLHWMLAVMLCAAPWRMLELCCRLFEPVSWWSCRACGEVIACVEELDLVLTEIRNDFVPLCNSVAKIRFAACQWCHPEGTGDAPAQIVNFHSDASLEHEALMHLLSGVIDSVPESVSQQVHTWLEMHDAHLYYTALKSYVHCLICAGRIGTELHGLLMESVDKAEVSFGQATAKARQRIQEEVDDSWAKARSQGYCCKCAILDFEVTRRIVSSTVQAATYDYLAMMAFLIVTLTGYRAPRLFADLRLSKASVPTASKFKAISLRHFYALCREAIISAEVLCLFGLLLISLVRFPEAFEGAVSQRHSLESLRNLLHFHLSAAVGQLWDIFSLLGFVKNYIFFSRVLLQSCLVPPACLNALLGRICPCFRLEIRFVASAITFYGLAFSPFIWQMIDHSVQASTYTQGSLVMILVMLTGNILSVQRQDTFRTIRADDWAPPTMRVTWCNALSLSVVSLQPLALSCWIWNQLHIAEEDPAQLQMLLNSWILRHAEALQRFGLISAMSFLLLVSGVFVSADENRGGLRSPMFRVSQLLLSHVLFVPTVGCLLIPAFMEDKAENTTGQAAGRDRLQLALLCAYLVTTQIFSSESGLMDSLPKECGIDVRYPAIYMMGAQLGDLIIIILPLLIDSEGWRLTMALATTLILIAWTLLYERIHGYPPCCVPHVAKLRLGGSMALAWTVVCALLDWVSTALLLSGLGLMMVGIVMLARTARSSTVLDRHRLVADTGICGVVMDLIDAQDVLCVHEAIDVGNRGYGRRRRRHERWRAELESALTAKSVAFQILDFEDHVLAERLDVEFLDRRAAWRLELPAVQDFPEIIALVNELRQSLRTPSTLPALLQLSRQLLRRHDLAPKLVDYLIGHRALHELMEAALFTMPSATARSVLLEEEAEDSAAASVSSDASRRTIDMATHCCLAREAIEDVLLNFGLRPEDSTASDVWMTGQSSSDSGSDSGSANDGGDYLPKRVAKEARKKFGLLFLWNFALCGIFISGKEIDILAVSETIMVGFTTFSLCVHYMSGNSRGTIFLFSWAGSLVGLGVGFFCVFSLSKGSPLAGFVFGAMGLVIWVGYSFFGFLIGSVIWAVLCLKRYLARKKEQDSVLRKHDIRIYDQYGNVFTSRPIDVKLAGWALRMLSSQSSATPDTPVTE